jgi:hypothetical protein
MDWAMVIPSNNVVIFEVNLGFRLVQLTGITSCQVEQNPFFYSHLFGFCFSGSKFSGLNLTLTRGYPGSTTSNKREPKSHVGRVFNFKWGSFA